MKRTKRLAVLIVVLALLLPLSPRAGADGDARFDGKSWEQIVEDFFDAHGANADKVACGWMNTVTGESHFFNGDKYMVSGSMYKIPMNMLFTERIHNGELSWDSWVGGYKYEYALKATVVESNNDVARSMWEYLGGYQPYRHMIAPYMGEDPDTVEEKFYENNFFTSEQMIYCLNLLCTESERFPRLIDTLLEAEPNKYFKLHQHDCDIAHKYGYFVDGTHFYLNDCAICYTSEPVCIVLFTDTVVEPYALLADFCDLMVDYSEYSTAERLAEEQRKAEEAAIAALSSPEPTEESSSPTDGGAETTAPSASPTGTETQSTDSKALTVLLRAALALAVAVVAVIFLLAAAKKAGKSKIKLPWAAAAVLLCVLALTVCIFPSRAAPSAAPAEQELDGADECVDAFFSALCSGDTKSAYALMYGCSDLGIDTVPEGEDAAAIWAAVRASWSYKPYGGSEASAAGVHRQVLFTCLDVRALSAEIKKQTESNVESLAASLPQDEVYAEDGGYLDSFTRRAYDEAVESVLAHAADFNAMTGLNIELKKVGGKWLIVPDDALIRALSGGTQG